MLDKAAEHGYTEYYLPMIANTESLTATGQLPKFSDDLFQLTDDYLPHSNRRSAFNKSL